MVQSRISNTQPQKYLEAFWMLLELAGEAWLSMFRVAGGDFHTCVFFFCSFVVLPDLVPKIKIKN